MPAVSAPRGGPSERLKPLQAGGASTGVAGNRLLGVVSGTVTRQAARLRVFFHYDEAGRRIAECRATLGPGTTC